MTRIRGADGASATALWPAAAKDRGVRTEPPGSNPGRALGGPTRAETRVVVGAGTKPAPGYGHRTASAGSCPKIETMRQPAPVLTSE